LQAKLLVFELYNRSQNTGYIVCFVADTNHKL